MKFVVAKRCNILGSGLGNEMIPWAKGYIASQILGARLIGPSWGLNGRRYYRNFGTSRLDFIAEEIIRRLPHHDFTDEDFDAMGTDDFAEAFSKWSQAKGLLKRGNFVVVVDSMYWGYPAVRSAREFLRMQLLKSKGVAEHVFSVTSKQDSTKLQVAVHLRLGSDFSKTSVGENIRGKANVQIPLEWYISVCNEIRTALDGNCEFRIYSDIRSDGFRQMVELFNPGQEELAGLTECSDLVLMSLADLRVCSVSSYSTAACFLSKGPYIWYEAALEYERGFYSSPFKMPGIRRTLTQSHEKIIEGLGSRSENSESFRGWPIASSSGLPSGLAAQLRRTVDQKQKACDLLHYGVVPDWALTK